MDLPYNIQKEHRWRLRIVERRFLLMIGDLLAGVMAVMLALLYWSARDAYYQFSANFLLEHVPLWFYFLPLAWLVLLTELYNVRRAASWSETAKSIGTAGLIGLTLYLGFYFTLTTEALPRISVIVFLAIVILLTMAWRFLYIRVLNSEQFLRRVLVVGGGQSGQIILQVINNIEPRPFFVLGIVDDDAKKLHTEIEGYEVVGTGEDLLEVIQEKHISDIIVAITGEIYGHTFQALLDAQELGVDIIRMPVAYEELIQRVPIQLLESNWILHTFVDENRVSGSYRLGKRFLDIIGGLVGTLL
ncbi:MAG: hypothetical protein U9O54_01955, partial [Chloroflexota bacterium]|nr:hypothetical protein [Chloroflexota bacterium]